MASKHSFKSDDIVRINAGGGRRFIRRIKAVLPNIEGGYVVYVPNSDDGDAACRYWNEDCMTLVRSAPRSSRGK